MYFFIVLTIEMLLAIIPGSIAKNKGRNFAIWYIYGVFLFPIAFFHSLFLNDQSDVADTHVRTEPMYFSPEVKVREVSQDIPKEIDINAIANMESYALFFKNDEMFIRFKIRNSGNKPIRAIRIIGKAYTDFGDLVTVDEKESFEILLQDLSISKLQLEEKVCSLDSRLSNARNFEFFISQVCFRDGEIVQCKLPNMVTTCQDEICAELLSFAKRENSNAKYYMINYENCWQCVCGYVNTNDSCAHCRMSKKSAQRYSKDAIKSSYESFLEAERARVEREEEERKRAIEEEEAQNRTTILKIVLVSGVIILCLVLIIWFNNFITGVRDSQVYNKGIQYSEAREWESAMSEFSDILEYKDAKNQYDNAAENLESEIKESLSKNRNACEEIIDTEYSYAWKYAEISSFMGKDYDMINKYSELNTDGYTWECNYGETSYNREVYDLVNEEDAKDIEMTIVLDKDGLKEVYKKWTGVDSYSASEQLEAMCGCFKRKYDEQVEDSYFWYYEDAPISCIEFRMDTELESMAQYTLLFYR